MVGARVRLDDEDLDVAGRTGIVERVAADGLVDVLLDGDAETDAFRPTLPAWIAPAFVGIGISVSSPGVTVLDPVH